MTPPTAYSEERIVEEPAIALFADLGWQTAHAMEGKFGAGATLGARRRARGGGLGEGISTACLVT